MDKWFKYATVYQIYPLSFNDSTGNGIGDINGIIEKLPYLNELGVDIIWLSPLYDSPMDDNGYDIKDYYSINPLFGTLDDFKLLLKSAHKKNIKIIMDLVINHTSDEHSYFKEALKGKDNPYRDYYIWRDGENGKPPNDIQSVFGGDAWTYDKTTDQYYFHLFSKKQPDLNWDNEALREAMFSMINWWLDLGVDGFRLDVIDLIGKAVHRKQIAKGPFLYERLETLYDRCFKGKKILTVGETPTFNIDDAVLYTSEKNPLLDMVFNFEHVGLDEVPHQGKWALKSLKTNELKNVFNKWQKGLETSGWNSLYWSNHDQPRAVSRFGNDQEFHQMSAKMLAAILHLMRGTPYIYQGEEIGMTNIKMNNIHDYKDIETLNIYKELKQKGCDEQSIMSSINAKSRDNARTPMQWNDSLYAGFSNHLPWLKVNENYRTINVEKALREPDSIFHFYKKLIALRKTKPIITDGSFTMINTKDDALFTYKRELGNETLLVLANFSDTVIIHNTEYTDESIILSNYKEGFIQKKLRPYEVIVLEL